MIRTGLVHGDLRSHVILSPPCIVAGANHVCECIALAINVAYEDHGDLPRKASVQLDNASTNHNMLVFGFVSLYVMFGFFDTFRVRSASSQEALARASHPPVPSLTSHSPTVPYLTRSRVRASCQV